VSMATMRPGVKRIASGKEMIMKLTCHLSP